MSTGNRTCDGGRGATCATEHPIDTARRALMQAADLMDEERWRRALQTIAGGLPTVGITPGFDPLPPGTILPGTDRPATVEPSLPPVLPANVVRFEVARARRGHQPIGAA